MNYTKTQIRRTLRSLVTDRMYCMEHGHMARTADLIASCKRITIQLDAHMLHGLNAHNAIVRNFATDIRRLAHTVGTKQQLRQDALAIVQSLAPIRSPYQPVQYEKSI